MSVTTGYGFTKFILASEFESWLRRQNITRKITRLQVHHMFMPDYSCWAKDDPLRRQNNLRDYHMKENGWADIAQQLSIFPDGSIVTGRSFNQTPVGIKGWNEGAVCVEIYGNFDTGKDSMTQAQKDAIIAVYGIMCKVFNITPSTDTIRYHAWFTAGGTYLGDYSKPKSAKTCPGTGFFGGNTKSAMVNNFLPLIKNYINGNINNGNSSSSDTPTFGGVSYTRLLYYTSPMIKGEDVKAVQIKLKDKNYHNDSIDGKFGPATAKSVKAFQKDNNLAVDGKVGQKTWTKLFSEQIYYRVVTGTFSNRDNAESEKAKLKALGYSPFLVPYDGNLRVVAVSVDNRTEAQKVVDQLKAKGYSPFIAPFTLS